MGEVRTREAILCGMWERQGKWSYLGGIRGADIGTLSAYRRTFMYLVFCTGVTMQCQLIGFMQTGVETGVLMTKAWQDQHKAHPQFLLMIQRKRIFILQDEPHLLFDLQRWVVYMYNLRNRQSASVTKVIR